MKKKIKFTCVLLVLVMVFSTVAAIPASAAKATTIETKLVQKNLNWLYYRDASNAILSEDGNWGSKTDQAMVKYKQWAKISYIDQQQLYRHLRETVELIQDYLNCKKIGVSAISVDGDAGTATKNATKAFQSVYNKTHKGNLQIDGIMGPQTLTALTRNNNSCC